MSGQIDAVNAGEKRNERPIKVAACLVVRNEVSEIGAWLAWYHTLGFDACIVYDDGSTDGTWEVLVAASKVQDIRLSMTQGDLNGFHGDRQNDCYIQAIKKYKGEFGWIGFFDCDEYLRIMDGSSIKDFLGRFSVGSVSVNWCRYGSNGHVLKPSAPPPEAYTFHSKNTAPINKHVKALLHLDSWRGKYVNVHYFDVPEGTAVDPSGVPVQWSKTPGITETLPDWSVAKIMHYQCRSMEHYVDRLKRYPFLPRNAAHFNSSNSNDIEDKSPLALMPAVREQIARFKLPVSG